MPNTKLFIEYKDALVTNTLVIYIIFRMKNRYLIKEKSVPGKIMGNIELFGSI